MGSLFKTREWWSTKFDDEQGFDTNSLIAANIDNSSDGEDKVIVGGLSGILRIFSLSKGIEDYEATDLLLEIDLNLPILQISAGFFLTASDRVHLAILHPRKLAVYSVSGTGGFSEQGSSHNMLLLYEHKLQRSSFNMVTGPFGQCLNRDFFCVQSLDGTLSFFEQENFAFTRFLPNHLLPTPMSYSKTSDSFILSSSSWSLESYRYQVLAIARDEEDPNRQERVKGHIQIGGRRITPDWNVILGENAIDINVVMLDNKTEVVVVLGERNLFVMDVDGSSYRFCLRFDFCPISIHCFASNGSLISLIASEFRAINVFKDTALVWAAQTSFLPISLTRAQLSSCPGIIVTLSDCGQLSCSYLGSNPSMNIISLTPLKGEPFDMVKSEEEMNRLKKVISSMEEEFSTVVSGTKKHHVQADVMIEVLKMELIENSKHGGNNNLPSNRRVMIPINLHVKSPVKDVRLTFDTSFPLYIETNVIFFPSLDSQSANRAVVVVETSNKCLPASLKVIITLTFNNTSGVPRVLCNTCFMPLELLAKLSKPLKENRYVISWDVISNSNINFCNLFPDLLIENEEEFISMKEIGIEFWIPKTHTVTIKISSKNPKQTFRIECDGFEELAFVATEIIRRLQSQHVKFDAAVIDRENGLQLKSFFDVIDKHHEIRTEISRAEASLAKCMAQLRTIEKRFLVKLKDRNPAPLNDVDLLLHHSSIKTVRFSERITYLTEQFEKSSNILSFCTRLVVQLSSIATGMKTEQANIVHSYIPSHLSPQLDEGWEERVEVALSEIVGVEDNYSASSVMTIPSNTKKLKELITKLMTLLLKGDFFTSRNVHDSKIVSRDSPPPGSSQMKKNYTNPATEVIPEEEEDDSASLKLNQN